MEDGCYRIAKAWNSLSHDFYPIFQLNYKNTSSLVAITHAFCFGLKLFTICVITNGNIQPLPGRLYAAKARLH